MSSGGTYLAAAYVTVFLVLLAYVGIITAKLGRFARQIAELRRRADEAGDANASERAAA
jgi:hypothetical protein